PLSRLYQEANVRNEELSSRSENCCASSRLLILPRSFVGIMSTIKIRFGTCHPLNEVRQNRKRSLSLTSGDASTHAATSSFRNPAPAGRPNTTACRTPLKRSRCASTSAGFTFFPATLITSETRPTILSAEPYRASRSLGARTLWRGRG